ncbi:response regulator [Colwellia psychrerythraea]|uniref:Two component transcriptional regulator, winged helix family n=1 Tax=Colwellia psychrerythraea TaxID=28229 RepID=A0A099K8G9_COLPS|nr:response regulator [Colwellia psychrerythraea]KGJ86606.1 two component transcriptional regulator, winged helix family [Colwellia psychrerythraea]
MSHILIVEDEEKIASLLADYLTKAGYQTTTMYEGTEVVSTVKNNHFDLILLDLMLPGKDGLAICREIQEFSNIAMIMVTARVDEIDRLLGLELGADDYICKPFSPREVVARVKTILKRVNPSLRSSNHTSIAEPTATLELNSENYQATINQQPVELTAIEFNLLNILARAPGRIYSRSQLIDQVYQDNRIVSERTIDSHIKKLRKKLNAIESDNELVQSVYSVGYKLVLT